MHACGGRLQAGLRAHYRAILRAVEVDATGSCQRCNVHRGGSRLYEGLRGSASGSTSGENVVDQQDAPAANGLGICDSEGAAHVYPALPRSQARLALGRTLAH